MNGATAGGEYLIYFNPYFFALLLGKQIYHHKIVLLGDMGVGKTCISIR